METDTVEFGSEVLAEPEPENVPEELILSPRQRSMRCIFTMVLVGLLSIGLYKLSEDHTAEKRVPVAAEAQQSKETATR